MKKICYVTLVLILSVQIVGCGNVIPEMSEDQQTLIVEYAAGTLLGNDLNYESKLLNEDKYNAEVELQKEIKAEKERREKLENLALSSKNEVDFENEESLQNQPIVDLRNLAEVLECDGVNVSCNSIVKTFTYPDSDEMVFSMKASSGCCLYVLTFDIENLSSEINNVDLLSKEVKYKISFDGQNYYNCLLTMFEEDMNLFKEELESEEVEEAVLIVEVKEDKVNEYNQAYLNVSYNNQTFDLKIFE